MAFDGIVLKNIEKELKHNILNGKIDKITQPDYETIIIHIRQRHGNYKLLISTHPNFGRIHLTSAVYKNPLTPPLFCMVLRKHLEGGKIIDLEQQGLERVFIICIEGYNEIGELVTKKLIVEIMGKHSNIILVNNKDNIIIDAIKRYTHEVNRYREILPNLPYLAPPVNKNINLLELEEEKLRAFIFDFDFSKKLLKFITENFQGISTPLAKELIFRAGLKEDILLEFLGDYELQRLWQELLALKDFIKEEKWEGLLYYAETKIVDFSAYPLTDSLKANQLISHPTISQAIDKFYLDKNLIIEVNKSKNELLKVIEKELKRLLKKRDIQKEKLNSLSGAEDFRICGELLTANIYLCKKGDQKVVVENFYDENKPYAITLDPSNTPAQNAQMYFRRYNKVKIGADNAKEQLKIINPEIFYLESVKQSVEQATLLEEVEEIRRELIGENYISLKYKDKKKKSTPQVIEPMYFKSSEGLTIIVGKNNKQNDYVTQKIAKDHDLWLHVKDIPGSHVIIQTNNKEVNDQTILEASHLAAYYSKAQNSSLVPVDYTKRKFVKKPNGAKPGMVIYEQQKTLYITPEKNIIEEIKQLASKSN